MSGTLNLALTDELRAFINAQCGDGTMYATPSEFVRDLVRQKKLQLEAARLREGIIEGYSDAIAGRTVRFEGDLSALLDRAES
jgi:antitoxin ParD1/3/4